MEDRAKARFEEDAADHGEKLQKREATEEATDRKLRGKEPKPPKEGPSPKDQYNFTDPISTVYPPKSPKAIFT